MGPQTPKRLKQVLDAVPPGYLVTASWLTERGFAYGSFRDYVKRGWLDRVARGVFRRPDPSAARPETASWQHCVLSMQHILDYQVHVGAGTALALQGHSHYLPLGGAPSIWLYGQPMPSWLARVRLDARLTTRTLSLFEDTKLGVENQGEVVEPLLVREAPQPWSLRTSTPERAILELLDELPDNVGFDKADKLFEGLVGLRPSLLTELLQSCRKIKTRRLFFVFADRHEHGWRKYVQPEAFDLGRGDRALVPGGTLHPHYRIVIPKQYVSPEESN